MRQDATDEGKGRTSLSAVELLGHGRLLHLCRLSIDCKIEGQQVSGGVVSLQKGHRQVDRQARLKPAQALRLGAFEGESTHAEGT